MNWIINFKGIPTNFSKNSVLTTQNTPTWK